MRDETRKEIEKLTVTAKMRGGTVDYMTITNLFYALKKSEQTDDVLAEIRDFFVAAGLQILNEPSIEDENEDITSVRPFNPALIDITSHKITLASIFSRLGQGEIKFDAEFQRRSDLWKTEQKSRLIESILLKIPLPAFYIDASKDDEWLIIDGLQRMSALRSFVVDKSDNKLVLDGLEFFKDFNGYAYDDLPRSFIRRMDETEINIFKVNPGTPENVKYNIFKRINTGGLKLEAQEIRNAMFQGAATRLTAELAQHEKFLLATDYRINPERMEDREFPARFFAVCYLGIDKYDGVSDNFLNESMIRMNSLSANEISRLQEEFVNVMSVCFEIFGNNAFRKIVDERRRPINKGIFDIWCHAIFHCSLHDREILVRRKVEVVSSFRDLCINDTSFHAALKASDKNYFLQRFEYANKIVKEVLSL